MTHRSSRWNECEESRGLIALYCRSALSLKLSRFALIFLSPFSFLTSSFPAQVVPLPLRFLRLMRSGIVHRVTTKQCLSATWLALITRRATGFGKRKQNFKKTIYETNLMNLFDLMFLRCTKYVGTLHFYLSNCCGALIIFCLLSSVDCLDYATLEQVFQAYKLSRYNCSLRDIYNQYKS